MVKAIVGANWGDEGKGKITDLLAEQSDIVVRFQGGANAGHTIINEYGRFALHTLPSGVFYKHITNVIGNGVALDIRKLAEEITSLETAGVPAPNLIISERAQLLMPYHILQDTYEEERLGGHAFGSTKSGIAPFYSDKYAKIGIQVCDLFHEDRLREHLEHAVSIKNILFQTMYHKPTVDVEALFAELLQLREIIRPYVGDAVTFLHEACQANRAILLEGQLGAMKDPDFGIYPMTTSSNTLAGYGCIGAGIPPRYIEDIVAGTKAYSSSVGGGDFVSEIFGEEADELRKRGGGLFGSNPLTGSIGVVTINLPRIAYKSKSREEFFGRLWRMVQIAKNSLEIKRKVVETETARGLYPYAAHYLRHVHARTGQYWYNHFNTIGIIGMNEACMNLFGPETDLTSPEGQAFAIEVMDYLRAEMSEIQEETGHFYNLEASPAEGTSYRLARLDRAQYPDILCAGTEETPYYTNSTQLPVGFTDDIFETLDLQDALQSRYTGAGTGRPQGSSPCPVRSPSRFRSRRSRPVPRPGRPLPIQRS